MKKEPFGWIYQITNDLNGKFYIGQTIYGTESRFKRHKKCARKMPRLQRGV